MILPGCNVDRFEDQLAKPRNDGKVITLGQGMRQRPNKRIGFGSTRGGFGTTRSGFGTTRGGGFGTTGPVFPNSGFGTTGPQSGTFGTTQAN